MKKKLFMISSVCSVFWTSTVAAAYDEQPRKVPSIEKAEKKFTADHQIHPIFTWDSPVIPSLSILHPSSPREAGMIDAPLHEMDSLINQAISEKVMPGAVAFVARGGKIVKNEAYGYSAKYADEFYTEMDKPIPMQENTIFDAASISKIFTSTAIMVLYEKGLVSLDDPVMKYIPEFAQNGKEQVTVRQLLTHTSGFVAWVPLYSQGSAREDRLKIVFKQPLAMPSGSTYTYSDLNMITLGAIIERVSGIRQDEFVEKNITKPLKMRDTMYNPPESIKMRIAATEVQTVPNRGLVWGEVHDENAWSLDGVAGHAGVFTTAQDLAKLAQAFLNNGSYGGKRILKASTVKLLLENQNQDFPGNDHGFGWELGQGWYMDALSDSTSFGHTGYTGTSIVISPKHKTIAILLTNRVHPSRTTISTNGIRRMFARQTADAIPVSIPGKESAWFSGYGDMLSRKLEAKLDLKTKTDLTFTQWHSLEQNADYGVVEVMVNEEWIELAKFEGTSKGWENQRVEIPKEAVKIRFTYHTDASVNGRGWYIKDAKIQSKNKKTALSFEASDWKLRNY